MKFGFISAGSVLATLLWMSAMPPTLAADNVQRNDNAQVMESFERQVDKAKAEKTLSDHTKQLVMFMLGVPLLVLLLITAALGIAMAIYGKQVFVMHMVCAGLTVTLAIVHAIVGLVWFYPF